MKYITIYSNAKSDYFENTPTNFKVKLPQKIILQDGAQIGLCEIHYTKSWYNIKNDEFFRLKYVKNGRLSEIECKFPAGNYDIEKLCKGINSIMEQSLKDFKNLKPPKFSYDSNIDRVKLRGGYESNRDIFPYLSDNLYNIIGFNKRKYEEESLNILIYLVKQIEDLRSKIEDHSLDVVPALNIKRLIFGKPYNNEFKGEKPYNLSAGYHYLYLYSDIIKPSFVGDSLTQLMKVVEIPDDVEFGKQISIKYPNIHFFDAINNVIDSIEVQLTDDTGEEIIFLGDALTIVKLCIK